MQSLNFLDIYDNNYAGIRATIFENKWNKSFLRNFKYFLDKILTKNSEDRLLE